MGSGWIDLTVWSPPYWRVKWAAGCRVAPGLRNLPGTLWRCPSTPQQHPQPHGHHRPVFQHAHQAQWGAAVAAHAGAIKVELVDIDRLDHRHPTFQAHGKRQQGDRRGLEASQQRQTQQQFEVGEHAGVTPQPPGQHVVLAEGTAERRWIHQFQAGQQRQRHPHEAPRAVAERQRDQRRDGKHGDDWPVAATPRLAWFDPEPPGQL